MIIVAVAAGGLLITGQREPEHAGKPVSEWLEVYQKQYADELAAMRETWRTATLVEDGKPDYRVESDATGKIGGLNM